MIFEGKSRGHRNNIINDKIKKVGFSFGSHTEYVFCSVLVLAGNVREKDKPYYNKSDFKYKYPESIYNKEENINNIDDNKKTTNSKITKIKNKYQLDDEDAPDNTISVKFIKETKLYNNKVYKVTKKYYTLSDGSTKIVEVEDY